MIFEIFRDMFLIGLVTTGGAQPLFSGSGGISMSRKHLAQFTGQKPSKFTPIQSAMPSVSGTSSSTTVGKPPDDPDGLITRGQETARSREVSSDEDKEQEGG